MTRVHFYHLGGGLDTASLVVAKLIQHALRRRQDCLVRLPGAAGAEPLGAAIGGLALAPFHSGDRVDPAVSINLCWGDDPGHHHGLLVNLAPGIAPWFSRFEGLAELVYDQPGLIADRRDAYRFYRDRGYPLHYSDLSRDLDLLHSA